MSTSDWTENPSVLNDRGRCAYVWYCTDVEYAIAALVFVRLLKERGIRRDVDLIVLHLPLPEHLLERMRQMGIITQLVAKINCSSTKSPYRHSFVKLRALQQTDYRRVVFIDADSLPLKSLDYLFEVPCENIAAPAAYWRPQPLWTTALMTMNPSLESWARVEKHFPTAMKKGLYDMDIVNLEFGNEIRTLPESCFSLNSEWEDLERPCFWSNPYEACSEVSVVHFTALGKPWTYSMDEVRRLRPRAYQPFYDQWQLWQDARDDVMDSIRLNQILERPELKRHIRMLGTTAPEEKKE